MMGIAREPPAPGVGREAELLGAGLAVRGRDTIAVRMIATLMRLEGARWPAVRPAYAVMLTALAIRCETRPAAVAEVYRWLRADMSPMLAAGSGEVRRARREALTMVAVEIAGLLHRFRGSLDRRSDPICCRC